MDTVNRHNIKIQKNSLEARIRKILRYKMTAWKQELGQWIISSNARSTEYIFYRTEKELYKKEQGSLKKWNIVPGSTFLVRSFMDIRQIAFQDLLFHVLSP